MKNHGFADSSFFTFHYLYLEDCASFTWLELLEEVIALVIDEDECWEVLNLNLPDSFHAELWVLNTLDALDAAL